MQLSISNIAWDNKFNEEIYEYMKILGFSGLEMAPTKIFAENAYDKINDAKLLLNFLNSKYNIIISSIQSIWYLRKENIFGTEEEREILIKYTKKIINFANILNCKNIVFGCPKNRIMHDNNQNSIAIEFFKILGDYAKIKNTAISLEPNPIIYGTNFINTTIEALKFVKNIDSKGLKVNVDLGTIIENQECIEIIKENINFVNHIHISEPYLNKIQKRKLHKDLSKLLKNLKYDKFVSIEMKNLDNIDIVKETMKYIKEVFE